MVLVWEELRLRRRSTRSSEDQSSVDRDQAASTDVSPVTMEVVGEVTVHARGTGTKTLCFGRDEVVLHCSTEIKKMTLK